MIELLALVSVLMCVSFPVLLVLLLVGMVAFANTFDLIGEMEE